MFFIFSSEFSIPHSALRISYTIFMVFEEPQWEYTSPRSLSQWYGHVHLLEDHVVGQWFCTDLQTGRPLWDRRFQRANTICGVSEDVIVASETRSDGPWTLTFGCYGISLLSGELLWTAHRKRGGGLLRLLDFIPGFTNGLRASPLALRGSECLNDRGRVIDVHTGEYLRKDSEDNFPKTVDEEDPSWVLYTCNRMVLDNGDKLVHATRKGFYLYRARPDGQHLWHFSLEGENHFIEGNYYSHRYQDGYLYLVASDRPIYVPVSPKDPYTIKPNRRRHFLWVLDVQTGAVCQKIDLSEETEKECRIEDIDDRYLLISREGKTLLCYRRRPDTTLRSSEQVA